MTLTIMEDNKSLDIIVKPEQRIQEVYRVLVENGFFSSISEMVQLQVYSKRQGKYINPILTFKQGKMCIRDRCDPESKKRRKTGGSQFEFWKCVWFP